MAAKGNFPSCLAYKKILNSPTYEVSRCFHGNPLAIKNLKRANSEDPNRKCTPLLVTDLPPRQSLWCIL